MEKEFQAFQQEVTDAYVKANKPLDAENMPMQSTRFTADCMFLAMKAKESGKSEELVAYIMDKVKQEYEENEGTIREFSERYKEADAERGFVVSPEEIRADELRRAQEMMPPPTKMECEENVEYYPDMADRIHG